MTGGAIERYGESLLLVTGDGAFYRLDWIPNSDRLVAHRLALSVPLDRTTFLEDAGDLAPPRAAESGGLLLRVTDMVLDTAPVPSQVFVAY